MEEEKKSQQSRTDLKGEEDLTCICLPVSTCDALTQDKPEHMERADSDQTHSSSTHHTESKTKCPLAHLNKFYVDFNV